MSHLSDKRKSFFHYLFITAMEGGIYWADAEEYRWYKRPDANKHPTAAVDPSAIVEDTDGFYAILSPEEGWGVEEAFVSETGLQQPITDNQSLRVDIDVIKRGWELFMEKVLAAVKAEDDTMEFSNHYYRQAIVQYLTDMDDGDSDSDVAELIVQLGLFGEHVYS